MAVSNHPRSAALWVTLACCSTMFWQGFNSRIVIVIYNNYSLRQELVYSTLTSLWYIIGAFVGAVITWWLGQYFGRKKTTLTAASIGLVGCILETSSGSSGIQIAVGRGINGLAAGIAVAIVSVWQAEMASAHNRGKRVLLLASANAAGVAVAAWVALGFSFVRGPASWRAPFGLQLVVLAVVFGTVCLAAESPRWLLARNNPDKARQVLANLRGEDQGSPFFVTYFQHFEHFHRSELLAKSSSTSGARQHTKNKRRLWLGALLQIMASVSGTPVLSYFLAISSRNNIGIDFRSYSIFGSALPTIFFVFTLLPLPFIDRRLGRRNLLIIGAVGQAICFLIPTIILGVQDRLDSGPAVFAFYLLFFLFWGLGFNGIPTLFAAEINCARMRVQGVAFATAWGWAFNVAMAFITGLGTFGLGYLFFIVFLLLNVLWVPIVWLLVPETNLRTLEQLDSYFLVGSAKMVLFREKDARQLWRRPREDQDGGIGDGLGHGTGNSRAPPYDTELEGRTGVPV